MILLFGLFGIIIIAHLNVNNAHYAPAQIFAHS